MAPAAVEASADSRDGEERMTTETDFPQLVPAGPQNPRVQQYLAIKKNTRPNPEKLACLEGLWEVTSARDAGLAFRALFVCPELFRGDAGRTLARTLAGDGVPAYRVSDRVLRRMADRDDPDGLAATAQLPRWGWHDIALRRHNRVAVLDGLEILGNVGTIIRCADGTGADAVILTNRRVRLTHPKIIHASLGSSFTVPAFEAGVEEAAAWLRGNDFRIVTTDTDAPVSYREADYRGRVAIVLGSEKYGIARAWRDAEDASVSIPMSGRMDSLNVGNAAVLMLYEAFCQQEPERFGAAQS